MRVHLLVSLLIVSTAFGCGKKKDKAPENPTTPTTPATPTTTPAPTTPTTTRATPATPTEPTTAPTTPSEPATAPTTPTAAAGKVDPVVVAELDKLQPQCKMENDYASCEWGATDVLVKFANDNQPTTLFETLGSLITSDDANRRMVALAMLDLSGVMGRLTPAATKAAATPAAADIFLDFIAKAERPSNQLQAATHIITIAGQTEALIKVLDAHAVENVKRQSFRAIMFYGRMAAFPRIQALANEPYMAEVALSSAANMYERTEEEKAAVCPWAQSFLGDANGDVASTAAGIMIQCQGSYVDALQDEGDRRLKAGDFKVPLSRSFRDICFQFMPGSSKGGQDAQCERNFKFLEKVVNDKKIEPAVRGESLWNIYYQRRDAKTKALMKKYLKNKVPEIAAQAKSAFESLKDVK